MEGWATSKENVPNKKRREKSFHSWPLKRNREVRGSISSWVPPGALDTFGGGTYTWAYHIFGRFRAAHSSVCFPSSNTACSSEELTVSGIKGEGFKARILENTEVKYQDWTTQVQFLLIPEAGTSLLGRDLMLKLGISLQVSPKGFLTSLNLLTTADEKYIHPDAWSREENQRKLPILPIHIKLNRLPPAPRK